MTKSPSSGDLCQLLRWQGSNLRPIAYAESTITNGADYIIVQILDPRRFDPHRTGLLLKRIVSTPSELLLEEFGLARDCPHGDGFPRIHLVFQPSLRLEAAVCPPLSLYDNWRKVKYTCRVLSSLYPKSVYILYHLYQNLSGLGLSDVILMLLDIVNNHTIGIFLLCIQLPEL